MTKKPITKRSRKKVSGTPVRVEIPEEDIIRWSHLKDQMENISEEYETLNNQLLEAVVTNGDTRLEARDPTTGIRLTLTLVGGEIVQVDDERLKKKLGSRLWNKVSSRKIDPDKLEDNIASGEVDARLVAECSSVTPKKKYFRRTKKGGSSST